MKKRRREEKGAVLIATIAILAFVGIMMGFLGQLVLYTSNYSSSLNLSLIHI